MASIVLKMSSSQRATANHDRLMFEVTTFLLRAAVCLGWNS